MNSVTNDKTEITEAQKFQQRITRLLLRLWPVVREIKDIQQLGYIRDVLWPLRAPDAKFQLGREITMDIHALVHVIVCEISKQPHSSKTTVGQVPN